MLATTKRAFQLARWIPWVLPIAARRVSSDPARFLDKLHDELPESDRRVLDRSDVARGLKENAAEAFTAERARDGIVMPAVGF